MQTILPADTYIVVNKTYLDNECRNVLSKLYQPIIGSTAINLYLTLWSDLDSLSIISTEFTHHSLMAKTRIKLMDLIEAREKLEAIGLLKTYLKVGDINNYIYELYSPLEPREFFDNPILSFALQSNIGKNEYKKIYKFFEIPKIKLDNYQDISSKFSDVFQTGDVSFIDTTSNIKTVRKLELIIDEKVDLNRVIADIPDDYLNKKSISKDIKSIIYKLAFIYNLNEDDLTELIRNSINEKHMVDKEVLRKNCQNYYTFEHKGSFPSLMYKKQPEYLRKTATDDTKKSKLIYTFETTTPFDYLSGKNRGLRPSKNELKILEELLIDYELNPGVVNVLIDYVLKINDNKLTKNFVLAIANQWKRKSIKTVEEAIELCKKENKNKKVSKKTIKEKKPEWYNLNIEEDIASDDEIQKLEEMLKR